VLADRRETAAQRPLYARSPVVGKSDTSATANLVLTTYGHLMPRSEDRMRKTIDAALGHECGALVFTQCVTSDHELWIVAGQRAWRGAMREYFKYRQLWSTWGFIGAGHSPDTPLTPILTSEN
jgi:hypothetical protein